MTEKQINNITEIAAKLIIEGKASFGNAIEMAIIEDNKRCLTAIEDLNDMRSGYINSNNQTQKAFGILLNNIYSKLQ